MNEREIAKRLAPKLRALLDLFKDHPPRNYLESEQLQEAEENVQMLEELANSEPEPWESNHGY